MKPAVVIFFFLLTAFLSPGKASAQTFDRGTFYTVMASSVLEEVDAQLNLLKTSGMKEKDAFEGALLMKKAGLGGSLRSKFNLFKSGRKKIEESITKDSGNPELRFLRLMIQENAPGILNYNDELKVDGLYIAQHFKNMSPVVQKAVIAYSKKSKVLNPELL